MMTSWLTQRLLLHRYESQPHSALFSSRTRSRADRCAGGFVRDLSRARRLDEMVFGGRGARRQFGRPQGNHLDAL